MINIETNKIYNEDCITYMRTLPNECIDLIVSDPPYYKAINEKWDKQWKTEEEYLNWCQDWFDECVRILKPTGVFYCYGNFDILSKQKVLIFDKQLNFRQNITLSKGLRAIAGRTSDKLRMFPTASEYLLYYTKQKLDNINLEIANYLRQEKDKCYQNGFNDKKLRELCGMSLKGGGALCHYWSASQWRFPAEEHYIKLQQTGYFQKSYKELKDLYEDKKHTFNLPTGVTDVWEFIPDKIRYGHKTQKPQDITDRIIKASSNEGDLVFIPFAGSGSEIESCIRNNRNYIATEIDNTYIEDIIKPRINKLKNIN